MPVSRKVEDWRMIPMNDAKRDNAHEITNVQVSVYDSEEIYENCTVQVWRNSVTGEESIGWWKNDD